MPSTPDLLLRARRCHDEGRFVAAADVLLEAFRADPDDPSVSRELGKVLRAMGDLDGAVDYLRRSWVIAPADPVTVSELVLALHDLGRRDEAVQVMLGSLDAGLADTGFVQALMNG